MQSQNQSNKDIVIVDNVEWTDPFLSLNTAIFPDSEYWERSDINPEVGQIRVVLISGYNSLYNDLNLLVEKKYYFLFQPALSSINGYDKDYAQEIEDFFIVNASIKKTNQHKQKILCLISINEVVNLKNFYLLV